MEKNKRNLYVAAGALTAFMVWTAAVSLIDVQPIGPQGSSVGFAAINRAFHSLTGVHMALYKITDWLSLVPLGFMAGFAITGLKQWIARKSILKVERSILALGGFYATVLAAYAFFEVCVVNCRPVLIGGVLEASYPSSTTLLVLTTMPTAIMQLNVRIRNRVLKRMVITVISAFAVFMVAGRLISGVHWVTDIVGGMMLSAGLVMLYAYFTE